MSNTHIQDGMGIFIMPVYVDDPNIFLYIEEAIDGIFQQTDDNWHLIMVEDVSPLRAETLKFMDFYKSHYGEKITVICNEQNLGPGLSRNAAIEYAYQKHSPFILFNDQDDISDKDRLKLTRNAFQEDQDVVVVYSAFTPIDERGNVIADEQLTFSIREILDCYRNVPSGKDMWYTMGIETGYINLTSATSALTRVARKFPFRGMLVSEDLDAWFRYSTEGNFVFIENMATKYRLPTSKNGSTSRSRHSDFYSTKSDVDFKAFSEVMEILIAQQRITINQANLLKARFRLRMIDTFLGENRIDLVVKEALDARRWLKQVEAAL